jgi:stage II sporulation protein D
MSNGCAKPVGAAGLALAAALLLTAAAAPGTLTLNAALPGYVRVVLADSGKTQSAGGKLQWLDGLRVLGTTDSAAEVALSGSLVRIRLGGKTHDAARLVAVPVSGYAQFGGRRYRGRLEFFAGQSGGLVVLNVLPLEDYLCGVVPSEMPADWPAEALKAQAIAARSYALTRMAAATGATYDVYGTVADQEYHGVSGEAAAATQAVADTAGQVLVYDNAPICAMYCSDAGGCTAPGRFPYLQPVYSFVPDCKWNGWQARLSLDQLAKFAQQDKQDFGKLQLVRTENDAVTGHLLELKAIGSKGRWKIGGKELRKRLGLTTMRSTRAWVFPADTTAAAAPPPPQFDRSGRPLKCFAPSGTAPALDSVAIMVADDDGTAGLGLRGQAPLGLPSASPSSTGQVLVQELSAGQAKAGLLLVGSGNGHGVGMSQYGAAELARQGWGYQDILLYFYRGTQLTELPAAFQHASDPAKYCTDGEDAVPVR